LCHSMTLLGGARKPFNRSLIILGNAISISIYAGELDLSL